ncbi:MAG TPA: folate-binding protein, partial [Nitrosomonas sp.]|nr:folate-binding protein [Nitrosomonas sp.]
MTDSSIIHLDHIATKSLLPEGSAFIVTLSNHYGLIRFSGEDAQTFLQGQLTCDLRHITAEQASYGGYCTPKGRVLANFLLWQCDHSYFMQLPVSLCDSIQKKLSLYKLRARVSIENVSQDYTCIGLVGPQATKILGALLTSIPAFDHSLQFIFNDKIAVVYFASDRIQLILPKENAESAL